MFDFLKRKIKSAVYSGAAYLSGGEVSWPNRDFDNFAKEAYLKNIIAYRCIDMIAQSVSSVPWYVMQWTTDGPEELDNHPMNYVLSRPNPGQSWQSFIYNLISYLKLNGNVFIWKIGPSSGPNRMNVQELYVVRPSQVKILKEDSTNKVIGYEYQQTSSKIIKFEVDPITGKCDLLHIKSFNPLDDIWGIATVEPAAREIDTNNAATDWQKGLLQNQARPGMLLMFERNLGEQQYNQLKKDIRENREGADKAGLTLILEGAKDAKPYSFSPTEMDFIEGNRDKARMIASAFGVPAQMLGIKGDSTFANFEQARTIFWEDTIIYNLTLIKSELNAWIFDNNGEIYLDYDLEEVPALQYKQEALWKKANDSAFLTINEKRELAGYDPIDDGDVVMVSATMIPLGADLTVDEKPVTEEDTDDQSDQ